MWCNNKGKKIMYSEPDIREFLIDKVKKYTEDVTSRLADEIILRNSEVRQELIEILKDLSKCCDTIRDSSRGTINALEMR